MTKDHPNYFDNASQLATTLLVMPHLEEIMLDCLVMTHLVMTHLVMILTAAVAIDK